MPILSAVSLVASAVLALAGPALAAFPGRNGRIAASYFDDPTGLGGAGARSGIWLLRPDRGPSQTPVQVIGCARTRTSPCDYSSSAFSPDGRWIAFDTGDVYSRERRIGVVRVNGTGRRLLPAAGADPGNPTWSPKGGRVLFDSPRSTAGGAAHDLYVVAADGSGRARRVVRDAADPSWSVRGLFAFERPGDAFNSRISVSRTSGAHAHVVSVSGGRCGSSNSRRIGRDPDFSPGGSRLVYYATCWERLVVVGADGHGARRVAATTSAQDPAWSPDGRLLTWFGYRSLGSGITDPGIYVGRVDGTHAHRISPTNRQEARGGTVFGISSPSWQPLRRQAATPPPRDGRG